MTEEEKKAVETPVENTPATDTTKETPAEVKMDAPVEAAKSDAPTDAPKTDTPAAPTDKPAPRQGGFRGRGGPGGQRGGGRPGGRGRGGPRGRRKNFRREKPEFEQKIVSLRRVTRVMAGGRRFSFSAAVVIGDKKGRVGFGLAKANDTAAAIDKAVRIAKKDMITLKLTENNSIPHDVQTKYKASEVLLRPVTGKGLAAGGGVRVVLELAGVDEVGGKLLSRSKNNINNARVTIEALRNFAVKK